MSRRADVLGKGRSGSFISRNRHIWGRVLLLLLLFQGLYVFRVRHSAVREEDSGRTTGTEGQAGYDLTSLFSSQSAGSDVGTAGRLSTNPEEVVGGDEAGQGLAGMSVGEGQDGAIGSGEESAKADAEATGFRAQGRSGEGSVKQLAGDGADDQSLGKAGSAVGAKTGGEELDVNLEFEQAGQDGTMKRQLAEGTNATLHEAEEVGLEQALPHLSAPVRRPSEIVDEGGGSEQAGAGGGEAGPGLLQDSAAKAAGAQTGGQGRELPEEQFHGDLPGVADKAIWPAPLREPPAGMACEAWLEEEDRVEYQRDFHAQPIVVANGESREWDCAVGCRHIAGFSPDADAHFGAGHGNGERNAVLRSMEPRTYYSINDVKTGHSNGYQVVMTVHLDSDVPVGYFSWEEYEIMRPLPEKNAWPAPAVAFVSNCNANNFRNQALEKLQSSIAVDSYGRCANNRPYQSDKLATISHYKFCLAFENSCEDDYVTEKFWQSLVAGCVPVVVGAPNIDDFVPAENSIVHIRSLEEVDAAVKQIQAIDQDPAVWNAMVEWKRSGPSDQFKALLDMSAVHSSCRLCIHLADAIRLAEEEEQRARSRPCRCRTVGPSGNAEVVYHIYVRERGTFYFTSIFVRSYELTLATLKAKISMAYKANNYVPVWRLKRPVVLVSERDLALNVYHVYPVGSTQKAALYGDAWFRDDVQLRAYLGQHPCATLEAIFV